MNKVSTWWTQFCEINREIFRFKSDDFSYFTLLAGVVVVGDIIAAFTPVYIWFLKLLVAQVVPSANLTGEIKGHVGLRIAFMLSVMVLLYLVLYAVRAPQILAKRSDIAEAARAGMAAEIEGLQRDKRTLIAQANYRDQLAAAVGVRFLSVKTHVELFNSDGDCRTIQEEVFQVFDLRLKDLVRQRASSCVHKRKAPNVIVSGLMTSGTWDHKEEDHANTRSYHVYFDPALQNTREAVRLTITEEVEKGFIMSRDKFPVPWWTEEQLERVGQLIIEPTDNLVLWIDFPNGYRVPEEDFSIRVGYGRTKTRHSLEELRLSSAQALKTTFLATGIYRTSLKVEKPLLGLTYMLCWRPLV
jgi:hypothetical protein